MAKINKRSATFTVEATEYAGEASKFVITAAETESDFVSFADAASGGGRDYFLEMTVAQDAVTTSLWNLAWASPGTEVDVLYRPYGNTTASTTQPHYSFTATVKEPDGDFIGGEADASTTAVNTVDLKWPLLAKPTKITA